MTPTIPTERAPRARPAGWLAAALAATLLAGCATAPSHPMGFFVTSANPGRGGDLGGLAGADRHCQTLAAAVGAGGRTWRAYLSTQGPNPVHARDRIGKGPWRNAKGEPVAASVDELHGPNSRLTKQTALTEKGEVVSGRGDAVNNHDVLTGSNTDGRAMAGDTDLTCSGWTSSGLGAAMVGHHDRTGLDQSAPAKSWNASHPSRGCSLDALRQTGGAGLYYCFAAD